MHLTINHCLHDDSTSSNSCMHVCINGKASKCIPAATTTAAVALLDGGPGRPSLVGEAVRQEAGEG